MVAVEWSYKASERKITKNLEMLKMKTVKRCLFNLNMFFLCFSVTILGCRVECTFEGFCASQAQVARRTNWKVLKDQQLAETEYGDKKIDDAVH
jgi:hypothetical protein